MTINNWQFFKQSLSQETHTCALDLTKGTGSYKVNRRNKSSRAHGGTKRCSLGCFLLPEVVPQVCSNHITGELVRNAHSQAPASPNGLETPHMGKLVLEKVLQMILMFAQAWEAQSYGNHIPALRSFSFLLNLLPASITLKTANYSMTEPSTNYLTFRITEKDDCLDIAPHLPLTQC